MAKPNDIPFLELLSALLDENTPLHPRYLYRLSNLGMHEKQQLNKNWPRIPLWRRQALLEDLAQLNEDDTLLSFDAIAHLGLKDPDPKVRLHAVRILIEYEDRSLIPIFLKMVEADPDFEVRAAVATALGDYVFAGEIEELRAETLRKIEETLLRVTQGQDAPLVRRRALESLGFSSRDEVTPLIEQAYHEKDRDWLTSALFAMGRSVDDRWNIKVMAMLDHPHSAVRVEAAKAAGELVISEAAPRLIELLGDDDEDVSDAGAWALSEIGGEGVREALEALLGSLEDEDRVEFIEEALGNLTFNEDMQLVDLFDFIPDDEDNLDFELDEDDNNDTTAGGKDVLA